MPDQAVSDRIREETIDALSRTLPHLRGQMEQSFAGNAVLREFDHRMSARGYSSHNVADDMAELLVVSWEITTGGAAQGVQVQGAHRQVRDIFLGNSRLRAMTNTERQEMAERIAYQVVISSLANKEYLRSGDRVQLAGLQQVVTTMLRQQGIDLANLRLTPQGFHRGA
jgi:ABC-type lipoprotein release transport system permease subunit